MGFKLKTSATMLNPRAASRRLLMMTVLLVLCVVTMRMLWGASDGKYVNIAAANWKGDKVNSLLVESYQIDQLDLAEVSPVHVPGTGLNIMSAVYRRHFPSLTRHSLILTGWMETYSALDKIVCCLISLESLLAEWTEVSAEVFHMNDTQASPTETQFYDVHFICPIEGKLETVPSAVSVSASSCESSQGKSDSLVVNTPSSTNGARTSEQSGIMKRDTVHVSDSETEGRVSTASSLIEKSIKESMKPVVLTNNTETVHQTPVNTRTAGRQEFEQTTGLKGNSVAGHQTETASHGLAVCLGSVHLKDVVDTTKLIDWFESWRTAGVQRIHLFFNEALPGVHAVLKVYVAQGFLEAKRWNLTTLAGYKDVTGAKERREMWQDLAYNDCLHRLSNYQFVLFTRPDQLVLPVKQNTTLLRELESILKTEPRISTVQLEPQMSSLCRSLNQSVGQGRNQGNTSDPTCPPDREKTPFYAWATLPQRVAYVTHKLQNIPLTIGDKIGVLPARIDDVLIFSRTESFTSQPKV